MANRIKGITVEIGGDTTKLSKALEGVNKNIKNTQTQLKDVQKLLKLDPSNTELLSQKHKLLADAVKATKDKLETLKTAAEQANDALACGDISQEHYDALQREIIETEQELQNLQNEAEKSHTALVKLGEAGAAIEKVVGKIADVGTTLTTHVTVPIVAAGTAAVKTASDFDSAMSKVAAVSGATGEDLEALRDKAREMGAKTKFSASEAAEAMNYMAMAGWKTQDMLGGIEGIMNLAAASVENLATTSDIVTDALTAFGLWNKVFDCISSVLNTIKSVVTTIWNAVSSFISSVLNAISSVVSSVWNSMKNTISSVMNTIKETVSNIWNNVKSAVSEKITAIKDTVVNGFNAAVSFVKGLASEAWNWGADIINGIVDGIKSCIGKVSDAVSGVADKIKSYLHFSVPDEGPLTDFESWMPDFMKGLAKGINQSKKYVETAISGVAEAMRITMKSDINMKLDGISGAMMNGGESTTVINNVHNDNSRTVNQTNKSPKLLSRLENYRQTRNALKV